MDLVLFTSVLDRYIRIQVLYTVNELCVTIFQKLCHSLSKVDLNICYS